MNKITLGGKIVYEPPDGAPFCNFFEETAGASRYGYGIFCMLGKDYKSLMNGGTKVVRLKMTCEPLQGGLEKDVILGRARFCSASSKNVINDSTTYDSTFVNVVVYDLGYLLNTSAAQYLYYNVVNTTSIDQTSAATIFYPSTLSGGTVEHTWAEIFSAYDLATPSSGFPSYNPRNIIFDRVPHGRMFDRLAAMYVWTVGRKSGNPDVYNLSTTTQALRQQLRFYSPNEQDADNAALLSTAEPCLLETTPNLFTATGMHLPSHIHCVFPAYNSAATDPYSPSNRSYTKEIAVGGGGDIKHLLHISEYLAYYDEAGAAYINTAELDAIAAEIAPRYFAALSREVNGGVVSVYAGLHPFTIDGRILSIRWESTEQGARTIISAGKVRTFSPLDELYGSLDSLQNQSISYVGAGNSGLSMSGARFLWGYGTGGSEEQTVVTQIRVNALNFEYKFRTVKANWATDESDWTVFAQGTTCAVTPASSGEILDWMGI